MPKPVFESAKFNDVLYAEITKNGDNTPVNFQLLLEEYHKLLNIEFTEEQRVKLLWYYGEYHDHFERVEDNNYELTDNIVLSKKGLEFLKKYGSHAGFQEEINQYPAKREKAQYDELKKGLKKEKSKLLSVRLQNINHGATILYGAIGIFLTIVSIKQQVHLDKLDSKIEQQTTKIDSMLKEIKSLQKLK